MNGLLITAGLLATFCTAGHLVIGGQSFLKPMLQASFDEVPKKVMHCVFHFITVDFVMATVVLLAAGFGVTFGINASLLVKYIAVQFAFFALTQVFMVSVSKIKGGLFKIFQWTLFILIALFAWLGAK
jgi:hypothetical protein